MTWSLYNVLYFDKICIKSIQLNVIYFNCHLYFILVYIRSFILAYIKYFKITLRVENIQNRFLGAIQKRKSNDYMYSTYS